MLPWKPFHYQTVEELQSDIDALGMELPLSGDWDIFSKPLDIYGKPLKNRLSIQPLEGFDAHRDGAPSDLTFRRYRRFSAGGSGLIWFESCSPSHYSQTSRWQLHITEGNLPVFQRLLWEIRDSAAHGIPPYLIVQLTHCGRNSRMDGDGTFPLTESIPPYCAAPSPYIVKKNAAIITDDQLDEVMEDYVRAARLMKRAGFDAVDIRGCHGYLISELLSSFTRENSRYGGPSFESRTRFLLETIDRVRCEADIPVAIRLNACDMVPYPYGWGMKDNGSMTPDLTEPLRLAGLLLERGVSLLNISMGRNHATHLQLPYNRGSHYPREHQLTAMAFYHGLARAFKEAYPEATIMTGTLSWPGIYAPHVAAGGMEAGWYDLPGFGRLPWAYPDYANDILKQGGLQREKCCVACNRCCDMIGAAASTGCPVGCPVRDAEIYAPLYREHCSPRTMSPQAVELFQMLDKPPAGG